MPFGLPSDWQLLPGFIPNMTALCLGFLPTSSYPELVGSGCAKYTFWAYEGAVLVVVSGWVT